ncbi:hypothetical protein ABEF92_006186 [Exophiala dermatitidis]|uniref:WAP domain-containing protein n=1 Tax=Exophiala dermatitidis (strain ATCC 34100 / CBS 525.76 / NIH/UT8656) TaxID=858893 RepID=H6C0S6_EXODN|nr:uncharacterized protein HMPREF1120_04532 [Exophiala dermatitidis NIH/UT8656]EHY56450.1 hypothetical protein HMPREF1120_04532 [Exophiala dermatitidis NIH/UT8656]
MVINEIKAAVLLALVNTTVLGAKDICYKPDGAETRSTTYTPCLSTGNATHCCDRGQTCLQNGPCLAKTNTSLTTGLCTDSTWGDKACFPYCLKPRRIHYISTVYRCSNDYWCCSDGANNTSCCEDDGVNKFRIPEDAQVQNGSAFRNGYSIAPVKNIVTAGKTATPSPRSQP